MVADTVLLVRFDFDFDFDFGLGLGLGLGLLRLGLTAGCITREGDACAASVLFPCCVFLPRMFDATH